jgi:hypothetical protein
MRPALRMLPEGSSTFPMIKAAFVLIATVVCSSCASLAQEKTRQLCAAQVSLSSRRSGGDPQALIGCIVRHNATVLRAEQDYSDYAHRFNLLVTDIEKHRHYRRLRSSLSRRAPSRQRDAALHQLGTLNQWLARQEDLELHRWHAYSPEVRRLVATVP